MVNEEDFENTDVSSEPNEHTFYKNDPNKFIPKLYNFKVLNSKCVNETALANSPPFWVLVDHLVGVVWKLYSKEKDGRKLGIMQLQWALEFIKMIKDDHGNLTKTLEGVKNTIEDALILKYASLPLESKRKKTVEPSDGNQVTLQRNTRFEGLPQTSQSASLTLRDVMSRTSKTTSVPTTGSELPLDGSVEIPSCVPPAKPSTPPSDMTLKMDDILKYLLFLKKEQQQKIYKEKKELIRIEDAINQVEAGQFNIEVWMKKSNDNSNNTNDSEEYGLLNQETETE